MKKYWVEFNYIDPNNEKKRYGEASILSENPDLLKTHIVELIDHPGVENQHIEIIKSTPWTFNTTEGTVLSSNIEGIDY